MSNLIRRAISAAPVWALAAVGFLVGGLFAAPPTHGQEATEQAAPAPEDTGLLSADELRVVVAPIAFYPDEVLAVVLPASTTGLQVVEAGRFLEKRKTDTSLKPDEDWDPSVAALINYPDVVNLMNADLDWTQKLGDAV